MKKEYATTMLVQVLKRLFGMATCVADCEQRAKWLVGAQDFADPFSASNQVVHGGGAPV